MICFVFEMDIYNLIADSGEEYESCNKEAMVLRAFLAMLDMKRDPVRF